MDMPMLRILDLLEENQRVTQNLISELRREFQRIGRVFGGPERKPEKVSVEEHRVVQRIVKQEKKKQRMMGLMETISTIVSSYMPHATFTSKDVLKTLRSYERFQDADLSAVQRTLQAMMNRTVKVVDKVAMKGPHGSSRGYILQRIEGPLPAIERNPPTTPAGRTVIGDLTLGDLTRDWVEQVVPGTEFTSSNLNYDLGKRLSRELTYSERAIISGTLNSLGHILARKDNEDRKGGVIWIRK